MKKILLTITWCISAYLANAQIKISAMPTATGPASNVWVPVLEGGINKKMQGFNFAILDSILMQTKYKTDTMRTNLYASIGAKVNLGNSDLTQLSANRVYNFGDVLGERKLYFGHPLNENISLLLSNNKTNKRGVFQVTTVDSIALVYMVLQLDPSQRKSVQSISDMFTDETSQIYQYPDSLSLKFYNTSGESWYNFNKERFKSQAIDAHGEIKTDSSVFLQNAGHGATEIRTRFIQHDDSNGSSWGLNSANDGFKTTYLLLHGVGANEAVLKVNDTSSVMALNSSNDQNTLWIQSDSGFAYLKYRVNGVISGYGGGSLQIKFPDAYGFGATNYFQEFQKKTGKIALLTDFADSATTLIPHTGLSKTVNPSLNTLDLYTDTVSSLNAQTASYTLTLADQYNKIVTVSNASANTLTVPPNADVAFPVGTVITIVSTGAGQTTVAAGAGVTINSSGGKLKLTGQYSSGALVKTATNTWLLIGDLSL